MVGVQISCGSILWAYPLESNFTCVKGLQQSIQQRREDFYCISRLTTDARRRSQTSYTAHVMALSAMSLNAQNKMQNQCIHYLWALWDVLHVLYLHTHTAVDAACAWRHTHLTVVILITWKTQMPPIWAPYCENISKFWDLPCISVSPMHTYKY